MRITYPKRSVGITGGRYTSNKRRNMHVATMVKGGGVTAKITSKPDKTLQEVQQDKPVMDSVIKSLENLSINKKPKKKINFNI